MNDDKQPVAHEPEGWRKLLEEAAHCISQAVEYEQDGYDGPMMPATEWDYAAEQLARCIDETLAASPARTESAAPVDVSDLFADRATVMRVFEFYKKHSMGSLAAPSCLVCGQSTQGVDVAIRHMELPDIVVCANCKPPAPSPVSGADELPDDARVAALCDGQYVAGLKAGFALGDHGDNEGLAKAIDSRAGYVAVLRSTRAALAPTPTGQPTFQSRVQPWMLACFGAEIAGDRMERNHRFFEEATETVQANGMTRSEAHQLVDYTFDRPVGELNQEVGGVMVTLAALCLASGVDMHAAGETELARVWTKIEKIRAKQAAKPKHSPLPEHVAPTGQQALSAAAVRNLVVQHAVEWSVWDDSTLHKVDFGEYGFQNFIAAILATAAPATADARPIPWRLIVQAIRAVGDEAARRGEMYPQTSDEQVMDRKATRRVAEQIEWYATNGGAVAERLADWPKLGAAMQRSGQ